MPADAPAKLPEIEHIKARKDGLDVLADIVLQTVETSATDGSVT